MHLRLTPLVAAVLAVIFLTTDLYAQTDFEGQTAGGGFYRFRVPDGWAAGDSLVIWNHGFSLDPPGPVTDLGPLVDVQITEGYAVAASSYRQSGWALFKTNKDLKAMVTAFRARVGNPGEIIITGASLGGGVTAYALEKARLGNVTGALTICGAVGGSRSWDGGLDLRLLYDAICSDVPGAALPGAASGLPADSALSDQEILAAVDVCTGVGLPNRQRTRDQKKRLERLLELSRIPESFVEGDMIFATQGLADLTHDRGKLKGRLGVGNANVDYGDDEINDIIERVESQRRAGKKLRKNFTPKGKVGAVKIVSIHTDKDGLVIVENESEFASVVPPGNLTTGIVVEDVPSHCVFSVTEVLTAWESLTAWIDSGVQPTVTDLQESCESFEPLFGGPCRYDPNFVIPDMDERIRPR